MKALLSFIVLFQVCAGKRRGEGRSARVVGIQYSLMYLFLSLYLFDLYLHVDFDHIFSPS